MAAKLMADPRIDPRIKAVFGGWPDLPPAAMRKDRDQLLAEVSTPEAQGARRGDEGDAGGDGQRGDRAVGRA